MMKISGEMSNVVNIIRKDSDGSKKTSSSDMRSKDNAADVVSVENRHAASVQVENLDQARSLIGDISKDMANHSSDLHNLNSERLATLIS